VKVSTLFSQINGAYRGTDDDAPVAETTDYTLWLDTTNRKISEWARDQKNAWKSLYEARELGTVSAGTQSYDLDDDVLAPSDVVSIATLVNGTVEYKLVDPGDSDRTQSAYISGHDPQTLTFTDTITSADPIVGGTISLPGRFMPSELTKATDIVPVDDPYWLVYAVAAELAFNELTYASKAPDLVAKANNLYTVMAHNNRRGSSRSPRTVRTQVKRISGSV
jgi:hypothetical protein